MSRASPEQTLSRAEWVPNPARPDGRAIHYGDFARQRVHSPPFMGVRNPARPGGGAIDYGNFGCRSRSRTPTPSDHAKRRSIGK